MKADRKILLAFLLNLFFSVFEAIGGLFTGSVAILSDALHDMGDALSIGIAFLLEKKSKSRPDQTHTYGYGRYSVLGGLITTTILLVGSFLVIVHGIQRIFHPVPIRYDSMIVFAIVGVLVNLAAAFFTRNGESINQKAVNLHMLEDVLGWVVVLIGAIVMRFTDFAIIDPLLSIGVAAFILINALMTMGQVLDLFLEKTPAGIDIEKIKSHLLELDGVVDIHHVHIWSIDGQHHSATMHLRTDLPGHTIKAAVRQALKKHGILHVTLELETPDEPCLHETHQVPIQEHHHCHHHGHHHH